MYATKNNRIARGACTLVMLFTLPLARAEVSQTLDSVDAISAGKVLEMRFGNPAPDALCAPGDAPYKAGCITTYLPVPASSLPYAPDAGQKQSFATCQRAGDRQLYCLLNSYLSGGKVRQPVVRWADSGSFEALFDCTDPSLGLDARKANPCTTISADLAGDIWLGGRDGSAHSVIKVKEIPSSQTGCPAGFFASTTNSYPPMTALTDYVAGSRFCFLRYATGRPVLVDLSVIDAKVGKGFKVSGTTLGPGALLLEDRRTAVFIADAVDGNGKPVKPVPVELASGKSGFALNGNESVSSATILQYHCSGTDCYNFLLATTSTGRVMARRTDPLGSAVQVFANSTTCPTGVTQQSWVRVSPQSGLVYASDRCANVVRGLTVPTVPLSASAPLTASESLATTPDTSATNTLNTLSVSPGIPVDLSKCSAAAPCVFYQDQSIDDANAIGAQISDVKIELMTGKTGMAVFRITGIPDCRQSPFRGVAPCIVRDVNSSDPDLKNGAIVVIDGLEYLDVARLLPLEVTKLFDEFTQPTLANLELLVGPQFRARPDRGNTFDAYFGRTEEGVIFRENFDILFDIRELYGENPATTPTRCGYLNDPAVSPRSPDNWDAITTVSERYRVAGINNGTGAAPGGTLRYRDMLVNTSCQNPSAGSGTRWSLYPYGLVLSSCVTGNVISSGTYPCRTAFVDLADRLFDDLERARALTACANVDGNPPTGGSDSGWPLSATTCAKLKSDWVNARDKLNKCLEATQQPKNSSLNQNCQAFDSQFLQYRNTLDAAVVHGTVNSSGVQTGDLANRLGELDARVKVFLHVYRDQMLPSVPPGGFPLP